MSGQWYCPKCGPIQDVKFTRWAMHEDVSCSKCDSSNLLEDIPPFVTKMQEDIARLKSSYATLSAASIDVGNAKDARIAALEAGIGEMSQDPMGDYYTGLRCGVEDWNIHCRYEAAEYGWQQAFEYIGSIANNYLPEPQG